MKNYYFAFSLRFSFLWKKFFLVFFFVRMFKVKSLPLNTLIKLNLHWKVFFVHFRTAANFLSHKVICDFMQFVIFIASSNEFSLSISGWMFSPDPVRTATKEKTNFHLLGVRKIIYFYHFGRAIFSASMCAILLLDTAWMCWNFLAECFSFLWALFMFLLVESVSTCEHLIDTLGLSANFTLPTHTSTHFMFMH